MESFNGKDYIGFGKADGTLENGQRINAADAFLSPAKDRKNLYVLKSARGEEVIMSGNRATGVRVKLNDGQMIDVMASKEVILSAGSIETPHILMLSGIGPKNHLEDLGISNLVDLPVGQNLQDHALTFGVQVIFQNKTSEPWAMKDLLDSAYNYLLYKKGIK